MLDANNRVPTGRLRERAPLRLTIVVNLWRRQPEGVPAFARSRAYRSLAIFE